MMVKKGVPGVRTLAVGDGANDVPMISAAHIGVSLFEVLLISSLSSSSSSSTTTTTSSSYTTSSSSAFSFLFPFRCLFLVFFP